MVGLKQCEPCRRAFMTWSKFGKHCIERHGVGREQFWRRANQIGDAPCYLVRAESGRFFLMVQGVMAL